MSQKPILGDPRPTQDELVALGRERLVSLHNEAVNRLEYVLKTFSRNLSPSALRVLRFKSNDDIEAIRSALHALDSGDGAHNTELLLKTPSERSELISTEETADLFNALFELRLNWDDQTVTTIDIETARELQDIGEKLGQKLLDKRIQQAIWTLTGNRTLISGGIQDPSALESLNLTAKEKSDILDEIKKTIFHDSRRSFQFI
jgi:hypothetical protein